MEDPVFRLEGVVKVKNEMEDFEGPLNLILQLLSKDRIAIRDISISQILDQYLEYLDNADFMDLETASEFVEMASYLVYIKTKTLLYEDAEAEADELDKLIGSLEELQRKGVYTQIKEAAGRFEEMSLRGSGYFAKPPEYLPPDNGYKYFHEIKDLSDAMSRLFERDSFRDAGKTLRALVYPRRIAYPVADKAEEIISRLKDVGIMRLDSLFYECESRSETVAAFVAVLELCRTGSICLAGADDELTMSYTGSGTDFISGDYDVGDQNGNS